MSAKLGNVDLDAVLGRWIEPSVARLPWICLSQEKSTQGNCGVAESVMGIDGLLLERIPLEGWEGVGG